MIRKHVVESLSTLVWRKEPFEHTIKQISQLYKRLRRESSAAYIIKARASSGTRGGGGEFRNEFCTFKSVCV